MGESKKDRENNESRMGESWREDGSGKGRTGKKSQPRGEVQESGEIDIDN